MVHLDIQFDSDRPMDPTAALDYGATVALLIFYAILGLCTILTAKASTQARISLALKDPARINLMYLGSLLAATALFVSNKHLDFLDPVRNIHCAFWDYWILYGGLTLWIDFWIISLVTSRIRQSGFTSGAPPVVTYSDEDIKPSFTEDDAYEMDTVNLQSDPVKVSVAPHDMIEEDMPLMPSAGDDRDSDEPNTTPTPTDDTDSSASCGGGGGGCCCCSKAVHSARNWWHTRATVPVRLRIIRTCCDLTLLVIYIGICASAEIPGMTVFYEQYNACLSNFFFKIPVNAILFGYLCVAWSLYHMMTRKSYFMPLGSTAFLFSRNYRNSLLAMTAAMTLMIGLNMFSMLSMSVVRSLYMMIFLGLLLYGIYQIMGRTLWDCMRGTYTSDREIEDDLRRLDIPCALHDVVSDPAYATVLKEFCDYTAREEQGRVYLLNQHRTACQSMVSPAVVVLPEYVQLWNPRDGHIAVADHMYPIFIDRVISLYMDIWERKKRLSDTVGTVAGTMPLDRGADDIIRKYLRTTAESFRLLCNQRPQRTEIFYETIPAIPITTAVVEQLQTRATVHPCDLTLFQGLADYLISILQPIFWPKFYNDGRTMRYLRETNLVHEELVQSFSLTAVGSTRAVTYDEFGQQKIVDRNTAPFPLDNLQDAAITIFSIDDDDDEDDIDEIV